MRRRIPSLAASNPHNIGYLRMKRERTGHLIELSELTVKRMARWGNVDAGASIIDRFPDTPLDVLQDPRNVAETIRFVLTQPDETVIPEIMVLPMRETSWP